MATDDSNKAQAAAAATPSNTQPRFTTGVDGDGSTSADISMTGAEAALARTRQSDGASVELSLADGKAVPKAGDTSADTTTAPAPDGEAVPEGDAPPADTPAAGDPLPEFDAAKPEVLEAYEGRFFTADGTVSMEALTSEFWSNAKDGKIGSLNEGTYKFLEERLGISTAMAKAVEQGLVAQNRIDGQQFWQRVGGKQRYNAAVEWGKSTYSEAEKARFNDAINSKDLGRRDDAVDALLARYDRANPNQQQQRSGPPGRRRPGAPPRSVSSTASGAGDGQGGVSVPYPTQGEYQRAYNEAITAERNAKTPAERRAAVEKREKVRADGQRSHGTWR